MSVLSTASIQVPGFHLYKGSRDMYTLVSDTTVAIADKTGAVHQRPVVIPVLLGDTPETHKGLQPGQISAPSYMLWKDSNKWTMSRDVFTRMPQA